MDCHAVLFVTDGRIEVHQDNIYPVEGGGSPPGNGLLEMCCWMGSYFYDWTGYNGSASSGIFNSITRMGSHFNGTLRARNLFAQK